MEKSCITSGLVLFVTGNVFGFKPVATVQMTDKCKDVNLMRHVAHYQPDCRTIYKNMLKPGADVCR